MRAESGFRWTVSLGSSHCSETYFTQTHSSVGVPKRMRYGFARFTVSRLRRVLVAGCDTMGLRHCLLWRVASASRWRSVVREVRRSHEPQESKDAVCRRPNRVGLHSLLYVAASGAQPFAAVSTCIRSWYAVECGMRPLPSCGFTRLLRRVAASGMQLLAAVCGCFDM